MEYCNKGDLFQRITQQKKKKSFFEEKEIWNILIQVLFGLNELHKNNIYHRDLKSANIFLSKEGVAKIGDMNVSKMVKNGFLSTQTGTPYYASPEVWRDEAYDHKSDIWSFGCIIYEMTTLKPPFRAQSMEGLFKKVNKGVYEKIPKQYSKELSEIIKKMLQVNPKLRTDSNELLKDQNLIEHLDEHLNFINEENSTNSIFLSTIKIPKNIENFSFVMPKPNYKPLKLRIASKTTHNDKENNKFLLYKNINKLDLNKNLRSNKNIESDNDFINILKNKLNLPYICQNRLNNKNNGGRNP